MLWSEWVITLTPENVFILFIVHKIFHFTHIFWEERTQLQGETEADDKNVDIHDYEEADEFLIGRLMQMDFYMASESRLYAKRYGYKYLSKYNIR